MMTSNELREGLLREASAFYRTVLPKLPKSHVHELVGRSSPLFVSRFNTAPILDTTPPEVVMVTPSDGAVDIGVTTPVVLTFSESLNADTINSNTFALFANGQRISLSPNRSSDSRTVSLSTTLPESSAVTVAVTSRVTDISGNPLADFRSEFTTSATDSSSPSVVGQRPSSGASNVSLDKGVVLYVNEPLDELTVPGALFVSQDGELVSGTTRVDANGRAIVFEPDTSWERGALVEVFLTSSARDRSGNALSAYQGSFRVEAETVGRAPSIVAVSHQTLGVARNVVIEVKYDQELDPSTVNTSSVILFKGSDRVSYCGRWRPCDPDRNSAAGCEHVLQLRDSQYDPGRGR